MKSKPDHIDVKAHKSLIKNLDYLVSQGQIYEVQVDAYGDDVYLKAVDEISEEYSDWWDTSMSNQKPDSISRSDWVEAYKEGFKLGRSERKRSPESRRNDVADVVNDRRGYGPYSDAELDALQGGYELGREKAFPGADIDVKEEANTAYDKSGHAPGLSQWTGGSDE